VRVRGGGGGRGGVRGGGGSGGGGGCRGSSRRRGGGGLVDKISGMDSKGKRELTVVVVAGLSFHWYTFSDLTSQVADAKSPASAATYL
jgi:hypothetical protein